MASVIHIARYRTVGRVGREGRQELRLDIPAGDSDLRAVSIMLWLCSVLRVALAFAHHEPFGVEATLALGCVLLLPSHILRSRHAPNTARQQSR